MPEAALAFYLGRLWTGTERGGRIRTSGKAGLVAAAAAGLTVACGPEAASRAAATGGDGPAPVWAVESAALLFTATRDGRRELHLKDGLEAEPVWLSVEPGPQNFGRWSPDGSRIAYQSWAEGASEIFTTTLDPWAPTNVSSHPDHDVLPVWSPDGSRIAYMSTRGFELGGERGPFPGHVYSVRADGTDLDQLTREPLTSSLGPQDWSPDGSTILLSRSVEGSIDLFALDVGSGSERRLTATGADEYGAAYSPDGDRIAFHSERDGASQVEVMRADGSARRALTSGPGLRYSPRWSPDGAWLVYAVEGDVPEAYDVRAVNVADGTEIPLAQSPIDEREASWRPR